MQLHCLEEPKLERENVSYKTFVIFKFRRSFFDFLEVRRMEEGSSHSNNYRDKCSQREGSLPSLLHYEESAY